MELKENEYLLLYMNGDGDIRQKDRPAFEKSKGLETMINKLAGNKLFGFVHMPKSERSSTAALADVLDD